MPEPGPLMGNSGIAGGEPGSAETDAEPDAEPGLGVDETAVREPMIGSGAKRSCKLKPPLPRAVARSENCGWHVVLGGDNFPPLVWIGLTGMIML